LRNRCNVCGKRTIFLCDDAAERWIRRCAWSRSTPKYRASAWALVLQPGGVHCFTIPYLPGQRSVSRVDISGPANVYVLPKVSHEDPYRPEDSLVYTDFGSDLLDLLRPIGFHTFEHLVWDETCDIRDDLRPMRVFFSQKLGSEATSRRAESPR